MAMVINCCFKPIEDDEEYVVHIARDAKYGDEYWKGGGWGKYASGSGVLFAPKKLTGVTRLNCGWNEDWCAIVCEDCGRKQGYLW